MTISSSPPVIPELLHGSRIAWRINAHGEGR